MFESERLLNEAGIILRASGSQVLVHSTHGGGNEKGNGKPEK